MQPLTHDDLLDIPYSTAPILNVLQPSSAHTTLPQRLSILLDGMEAGHDTNSQPADSHWIMSRPQPPTSITQGHNRIGHHPRSSASPAAPAWPQDSRIGGTLDRTSGAALTEASAQCPYFEFPLLRSETVESASSPTQMPFGTNRDLSLSSTHPEAIGLILSTGYYLCSHKRCRHLKFTRLSDVKRHHNNMHSKTAMFWCRNSGCPRSWGQYDGKPFLRKDKRDEHERKMHKKGENTHETAG